MIKKFLVLLILLVSAACGNDNDGDNSGGNFSGDGSGSAVSLTRIYLAPTNSTKEVGTVVQYSALGLYSDNTSKDITDEAAWTSSNPAVAIINADGLTTTVAAGSTEISATLNLVLGKTTLTVIRLIPIFITVTPASPTLAVGATQQFTAAGTYADGSTKDLTNEAAWTSSNPAVATIGGDGLVTVIGVGSAEISASYEGVSRNTVLTAAILTPNIRVKPEKLDFGKFCWRYAGEAVKEVEVKNKGNYNLNIYSVAIGGRAYSIKENSCGVLLATGESCEIKVAFRVPGDSTLKYHGGKETGNLAINSNDPDSPVVNVELTAKVMPRSSGWGSCGR